MSAPRARLASWGRWPTATVRLLRIKHCYWVRVRGVGDFCLMNLAGAVIFGERMAERYG